MISKSFVNGSAPSIDANNMIFQYESTFKPMFDDVDVLCESVMSEINTYLFEASVEGRNKEKEAALTEQQKSVFEKIGSTIRNSIDALIQLITRIITNIKESSFKNKSDLEKIDVYCKKVSKEEGEKLLSAISAGDLDISDLKNLDEMHKLYMEFLKDVQNKNIDPNTLKGKFAIFKEKCKDFSKEHPVVTVAGAVSTVTGAALGVANLVRFFKEKSARTANCMKNAKEVADLTADALAALTGRLDDELLPTSSMDDYDRRDHIMKNLSKAQILSAAQAYYNGEVTKAIKILEKKDNKVTSTIKNIARKIIPTLEEKRKNGVEDLMYSAKVRSEKHNQNLADKAAKKQTDDQLNAEHLKKAKAETSEARAKATKAKADAKAWKDDPAGMAGANAQQVNLHDASTYINKNYTGNGNQNNGGKPKKGKTK